MYNGPNEILCGLLNVTTDWHSELAGQGKASGLPEYGSCLAHKSQNCSGSLEPYYRPRSLGKTCSAVRHMVF